MVVLRFNYAACARHVGVSMVSYKLPVFPWFQTNFRELLVAVHVIILQVHIIFAQQI